MSLAGASSTLIYLLIIIVVIVIIFALLRFLFGVLFIEPEILKSAVLNTNVYPEGVLVGVML